jgi:pre-rRNA-processing protein TSR3
MVDFNQCDSKKCTGRKMERFKLIKNINEKKKKFKGIVLSAFGKKFISN